MASTVSNPFFSSLKNKTFRSSEVNFLCLLLGKLSNRTSTLNEANICLTTGNLGQKIAQRSRVPISKCIRTLHYVPTYEQWKSSVKLT